MTANTATTGSNGTNLSASALMKIIESAEKWREMTTRRFTDVMSNHNAE
jgi:hypothetical protein